MSCNTFLGNVVHLLGTYLNIESLAAISDYRGVQRLIEIIPRDRDPVFETLWYRGPEVVYDAHRQIAVFSIVWGDDARGDQVIDLLDHDLLILQLFPKRIQTL